MKIVYCHCSVYNPGGMERVLLNKVKWLVASGHEVVVVTTDQDGRPPFYSFPDGVRMFDLAINYSADNNLPVHKKISGYLRKRRMHRRRLTELLMRERPAVTVSLYPSESSFIPSINDGSKKVLELHFNRYFRVQYGRKGLLGVIDRLRSRKDAAIAARFDSFVVLTREDRGYWGDMENICVIPNAAMKLSDKRSDCMSRRVLAIGRLDYQKGFDRLLDVWARVMRHQDLRDWRLDIYGQGEWHDYLIHLTETLGIGESVMINRPVQNIADVYTSGSILAMTSNYEGFPMVMIEAMSSGLPVVAYDFMCGPKDIIRNGVNGICVTNGDAEAFAGALARLMRDDRLRADMGAEAPHTLHAYSESMVMDRWMRLFDSLTQLQS